MGKMNTKHQDQLTHKLEAPVTGNIPVFTAIFPCDTSSPDVAAVTDGEQRNTELYLAAPCFKNTVTQRATWKHKLE